MTGGRDPRAVANYLLDIADKIGRPITNLAINKVTYFVHGNYLVYFGCPLVDARIEAWEYGPVIREIYHEFKSFKDRPITTRAKSFNLETGEKVTTGYDFSEEEHKFLQPVSEYYLSLRAGYLVDVSHVDDGPWHQVWFHNGRVNPGMEISNSLIEQHFSATRRH